MKTINYFLGLIKKVFTYFFNNKKIGNERSYNISNTYKNDTLVSLPAKSKFTGLNNRKRTKGRNIQYVLLKNKKGKFTRQYRLIRHAS